MSEPSDMADREGLAAEYVLGTLPLADRLAAELLIASDAGFRALVEDWQGRLAPLDAGYEPVDPPADLLARIEARLFPGAPVAARKRWRAPFWGALAAGLAVLALAVYLPRADDGSAVTATLTGENQPLIIDARFEPGTGRLTFTRSAGPAAAAGTDYELWVIPAGEKAVSLGVMQGDTTAVALPSLPAGTTLAVTLEPAGGSPTGQATGPILVATVIGG